MALPAVKDLNPAQAKRLIDWLDRTERLATLTNAELADIVLEHFWSTLPLSSPQADVLAEVIERLRRAEEAGA